MKRGDFARCNAGYLGIITCDYPDESNAWTGVHVETRGKVKAGDAWSSRNPKHATIIWSPNGLQVMDPDNLTHGDIAALAETEIPPKPVSAARVAAAKRENARIMTERNTQLQIIDDIKGMLLAARNSGDDSGARVLEDVRLFPTIKVTTRKAVLWGREFDVAINVANVSHLDDVS